MKKTSKTSKTLKIHPLCAMFPEMDEAAFNELVADIGANGLIHPIVTLGNKILDGRHRWRACKQLGVKPETIKYEGDDAQEFVIDKNRRRRHLSETQLAAWAATMVTSKVGGDRKSKDHLAGRLNDLVTEDDAAEMLDISKRTVTRGVKVLREGAPEVFKAMELDEVSVNDAENIAEESHADQREALKGKKEGTYKTLTAGIESIKNKRVSEKTMPKLPAKKYRVVVVDPPWDIKFFMDRSTALKQNAGTPYPTMSLDEIKAMKLPLADDAFVFLWTIQQYLEASFDALKAWGVERMFTMAWIKPHGPQTKGRPLSNMEFIQVGRVGKPAFRTTKQFAMAFDGAWKKEHSKKPDEFYQTIRRVTAGPRLDMFSRRNIDGFDAWGKEAK